MKVDNDPSGPVTQAYREDSDPANENLPAIAKEYPGFEYVTLDEVRTGKATLNPPKNLKLERFNVNLPEGVDLTTLAYEGRSY